MQAAHVLDYWYAPESRRQWYKASDAFDAEIRSRFERLSLDIAAELQTGRPHSWEASVEASLALIIVLDQFPRNMFRGTPAAFGWDVLALKTAKAMIEKGWDLKIDLDRRAFIYMPFMHSENIDDQLRCIELVGSRLENADTVFHAKEHCKIIERFGRFPHRNKILKRESTSKEQAFLDAGGYAP